jgi:hypothetical protein
LNLLFLTNLIDTSSNNPNNSNKMKLALFFWIAIMTGVAVNGSNANPEEEDGAVGTLRRGSGGVARSDERRGLKKKSCDAKTSELEASNSALQTNVQALLKSKAGLEADNTALQTELQECLDSITPSEQSCNGPLACDGVDRGVVDISVASCTAMFSCLGYRGEMIADNSCTDLASCEFAHGMIGSHSCTAPQSCYEFRGDSIGDGSCNGVIACKGISVSVGNDACNFGCNNVDEAFLEDRYGAGTTSVPDGECNVPNECDHKTP